MNCALLILQLMNQLKLSKSQVFLFSFLFTQIAHTHSLPQEICFSLVVHHALTSLLAISHTSPMFGKQWLVNIVWQTICLPLLSRPFQFDCEPLTSSIVVIQMIGRSPRLEGQRVCPIHFNRASKLRRADKFYESESLKFSNFCKTLKTSENFENFENSPNSKSRPMCLALFD